MAKMYYKVSSSSVLRHFRGSEPCACHWTNPDNPPLYNVMTIISEQYWLGHGALIKEIVIDCLSCGRSSHTDVEAYGVCEDEFNPR